MSFTKCSQCGLTTFLGAKHCPRCKAVFTVPSAPPTESDSSPADPLVRAEGFERINAGYDSTYESTLEKLKRRQPFSPLRILLTVLLIVGPVYYHFYKVELERAEIEMGNQQRAKEYNNMVLELRWRREQPAVDQSLRRGNRER